MRGLMSRRAVRQLSVKNPFSFLGHTCEWRSLGSFSDILLGEGKSYINKPEAHLVFGHLKIFLPLVRWPIVLDSCLTLWNISSTQKINTHEALGQTPVKYLFGRYDSEVGLARSWADFHHICMYVCPEYDDKLHPTGILLIVRMEVLRNL